MARFSWRLLYTGTIFLRFLLVTASPQFETTSTSDLGDSAIQHAATSLIPDPDAVPDAQWTSQPQDPDLIAQHQSPDDNAFIPPLISHSSPDTQILDANSQFLSGSCSTKDNLKAGASRLLRRVNGEIQPCCDPVNLGLEGPLGWIFGRNTIEERSPYCCEGGGVEYARTRICVPFNKSHELCRNPDNWTCCIYGGTIFNGKVHARHCWSMYPPPVKQQQQQQQQW